MEDLTGRVFGRLTALYRAEGKKVRWHCRCECGQETDVPAYDLTSGHTRSCGCLNSKNKDLTGQRFGHLTVLYPTAERQQNRVVWHCRCDCGNEADYASTTLRSGLAISCGCAKRGEDLAGRQFDRWTVLRQAERPNYWVCQCACGTVREIKRKSLTQGYSRSCGCLRSKVKDYTGQKLGGLLAIKATGEKVDKSPVYIWRCECGFEVTLPVNAVLPSEGRVCPKCLAKKRRDIAKKMLEDNKEKMIQNLLPGNLQNIKDGALQRNNTSGVRGVWKNQRSGMWMASGNALGRRWYLGMYKDIRDATEARKSFIEEWYGEAFVELDKRKQDAKEKPL